MSLLWRLLPAVRQRERSRFLFFMGLNLLLSLAQTLGLVATESLILSHWGSQALPLNFVAASLLTVLGSLAYALGVQRSKNDRYFIHLLIGFALLVLGLAGLAHLQQAWAFLALGCAYYLSLAILQNHYWTFTGDFFDTLSAKRLFPLFIVGNSLGGFLGGAFIILTGERVSTELLLPIWAGLLVLAAVTLRFGRRSLRRWGPLELEEADETSLDGIRNSLLYLRQSALGRWMVAACTALIVALFISQYLYSQIFAEAFPNGDDLTRFFGKLLAITNLLEVAIEVWLTPLLIRNLGVASANLIHPVATMLSFVMLASSFQLRTGIIARLNRETLDNALGAPIRNLVYNALPDRFRGRLRAFLEGIVVYSGMAAAGLFLTLSVDRVSTHVLTYCGLGASALYLWAHLKVRSAYLKTLVAELQAGRLELSELGDELASFEVQRLGQLWEALTAEASEHPNPVSVRFAQTLASRHIFDPLLRTAQSHPALWLRCTCLRALASQPQHLDPAKFSALVQSSLQRSEAEIRRATLELVAAVSPTPLAWQDGLKPLCADEQPQVSSLALTILLKNSPHDPQLLEQLQLQARDADSKRALPALQLIPPAGAPLLFERCKDEVAAIRQASLLRLGQLTLEPNGAQRALALFTEALSDPDSRVRVAGLRSLLSSQLMRPTPEELEHFSRLLGDPSSEVRSAAAQLLARSGDAAIEALLPHLRGENGKAVVAALDTLSLMGSARAREQLALQLRQRTQQIWYLNLAGLIVESQKGKLEERHATSLEFLIQTLSDAARRDLKLAFEILSHLEDTKVMKSVEKVLRFANVRARSDALEVLSNLGDREASNLLVLLLEDGPWEERTSQLPPTIKRPENTREVLRWCRDSQDRWLRLAASALLPSEDAHPSDPAGQPESAPGFKKEGLMERLLVLRKVPLFAQMSLDQLEAINQLLKEVQYLAGETIFEQGDLGDELYVLVEGSVRIVQGLGTSEEVELNRMSGVSYFGEMSILDDEPRSASVVADQDSRLLVLKGDQVKDLIHQMPEISFEIFKVLTARIRTANQRSSGNLKSGPLKVG